MLLDGHAFRRDPLTFLRRLDTQAPVLEFRAGTARFTLVTDPGLIRQVLVTDRARYGEGKWTRRGTFLLGDCLMTREGAPHRERRREMQPSFSRSRIEAKAPELVRSVQAWSEELEPGRRDDGHSLWADASVAAVCRALFDFDLRDADQSARTVASAVATVVEAIPHRPWARPRALLARRTLRRLAGQMNGGPLATSLREQGCGEDEIIREIVTMLVAGVDTTPRTLSRIWLELARDPELEQRLHEEIDAAWGPDGLRPEDLPRLELVQHLLLESMRLYPAVRFIDRRPLEHVVLAGTLVRKDADLLLCPLLAHRDPAVFEDPERFLPDRWRTIDAPPRFHFLPFGEGMHRCIGEWLARITLPSVLAHVARRFRVECEEPRHGNQQETHFDVRLVPRSVRPAPPRDAERASPRSESRGLGTTSARSTHSRLDGDATLDALDAVVYADLFDCAVRERDVLRFARRSLGPAEARELLDRACRSGILSRRGDVYCLRDREQVFTHFERRAQRAERLTRRAHRVASWLQHLPAVRGLALTGSVAAGQADGEADVDFLLIVEGRRMGTVFLLCGSLARVFGRGLLCPNYYLAEDRMALDRRSDFVARELLLAKPLCGAAADLVDHNPWATERFPNRESRSAPTVRARPIGRAVQRAIERLLGGRFGDLVERAACRVAWRRLEAHYGAGQVPQSVCGQWDARRELRFHRRMRTAGLLDRYERRRESLRQTCTDLLTDPSGPGSVAMSPSTRTEISATEIEADHRDSLTPLPEGVRV